LSLPRVPEEFDAIQVNHCRTPGCVNFGTAALTQAVAHGRARADGSSVKDRYKLDSTGKGAPAIQCRDCGIKSVLKSNVGIREEIDRVSAYLRPPAPACDNRKCANLGKSVELTPALYHGHGGGRFKCRRCGRTCSPAKPRLPSTDRTKKYKNTVILRSALGKMPVRRLLEALGVSATTF
jgi:hypothetical protein